MISEKLRASRLAPPTRAPSTSGLAEKFLGIGGFDAAAVLDADGLGDFFTVTLVDLAADEGVHVLCLLGGGSLASADGPDRFVGDHSVLQLLGVQIGQAAGNLLADHGFSFIGLTLGEGFAHTDNRLEAGG